MTPRPWKTLNSREVYANPWIRVREDVAELPTGRRTLYGVVETAGAVGVLPFVDRDRVLLVRQYRYVQREDFRWEMPTGGLHPGETPEAAAQRELMEEAGCRARTLTPVSTFYSSKSVVDETARLFLGEDLEAAAAVPDDTELLERRVFPFPEAVEMVRRSDIRDAMTVIAVLHAALRRAPG